MPDTVRESILADLHTTLAAVSSLKSAQRWEQNGNDFTETPMVVIAPAPEEKEDGPSALTTCRLDVDIDLYVRHDKNEFAGSTDAYLNGLLGAIEAALMADHTRGGHAIDTEITGNSPFEVIEGQALAGLIISIRVHYRHQRTDPTAGG